MIELYLKATEWKLLIDWAVDYNICSVEESNFDVICKEFIRFYLNQYYLEKLTAHGEKKK